MDFDTTTKMQVYRTIAETGTAPDVAAVAAALGVAAADVQTSFERLAKLRLLVLEPGDRSRIRMASPFSGIETPFLVRSGGMSYYANCVWDAYGISAALGRDAVVEAFDGFTGEPMMLEIRGGKPGSEEAVAHFAVPAAHWWDDIIHT